LNLRQINLEYVAVQDRLILRISYGNGEEVLLWLTRRCVKLLWPNLLGLAQTVPDIAMQSHPEAKSALLGMRHEAALAKSDFSKPYEGVAQGAALERPLGAEPILVARMQTRRNPDGKFLLSLLPREGQGVNVALDEALLHSICGLLRNIVAKTDWDLKLDWPYAATAAAAAEVPRSLN